ncbi:diamine N-acetyltransferase, partial [Tremellales sp. Uapishka_1]
MTNQPFHLRLAEADDVPQIVSLMGGTWEKFLSSSLPRSDIQHQLDTRLSHATISSDYAKPTDFFLVISPSDTPREIVGVAQLSPSPHKAKFSGAKTIELKWLFVHGDYQGKGLSKTLMVASQEKAKELGCDSIWLIVWEENVKGIEIYQKMGYEKKGETDYVIGETTRNLWVLEKML